ncbi:MAG: DUF1275 domain-containing protein [Lactobacillus sp.]|jgi:uncharacterized membrane protein YoaK (UPF0700 family)|nr:DUF1275 domain-containing protein [Lactobacillus sp.]
MKIIDRQLTYLTVGQTLLMGMLDAYTFSHFDGAFASAQTGNLVVFGVALSQQGWRTAASHLPIFFGFLIGAILAQLIRQQAAPLKPTTRLKLFTGLSIILPLALLALQPGPKWLSLSLLGLFASYELTIFNQIGTTTVNNGIMTGNIKNFGNSIYTFLSHPSTATGLKVGHFAIGIGTFILGVILGCSWFNQSPQLILLGGAVMNLSFLIYLTVVNRQPVTLLKKDEF